MSMDDSTDDSDEWERLDAPSELLSATAGTLHEPAIASRSAQHASTTLRARITPGSSAAPGGRPTMRSARLREFSSGSAAHHTRHDDTNVLPLPSKSLWAPLRRLWQASIAPLLSLLQGISFSLVWYGTQLLLLLLLSLVAAGVIYGGLYLVIVPRPHFVFPLNLSPERITGVGRDASTLVDAQELLGHPLRPLDLPDHAPQGQSSHDDGSSSTRMLSAAAELLRAAAGVNVDAQPAPEQFQRGSTAFLDLLRPPSAQWHASVHADARNMPAVPRLLRPGQQYDLKLNVRLLQRSDVIAPHADVYIDLLTPRSAAAVEADDAKAAACVQCCKRTATATPSPRSAVSEFDDDEAARGDVCKTVQMVRAADGRLVRVCAPEDDCSACNCSKPLLDVLPPHSSRSRMQARDAMRVRTQAGVDPSAMSVLASCVLPLSPVPIQSHTLARLRHAVRMLTYAVPVALGVMTEDAALGVPHHMSCLEGFTESEVHPATAVRVRLVPHLPSIVAADLVLHTRMTGLSYFMFHAFIPTALLVVAAITSCLSGAGIIACVALHTYVSGVVGIGIPSPYLKWAEADARTRHAVRDAHRGARRGDRAWSSSDTSSELVVEGEDALMQAFAAQMRAHASVAAAATRPPAAE